MTTIFYENLPVAHLNFEDSWILRRVSNLAERVTHSIQKRCKRIESQARTG